jgi:hypothetical protein
MFYFNLEDLLEGRYDIELDEYWKLPEDEKERITLIVVNVILNDLIKTEEQYERYKMLLDVGIDVSITNEEYEKAEMLKRIKDKFNEIMR